MPGCVRERPAAVWRWLALAGTVAIGMAALSAAPVPAPPELANFRDVDSLSITQAQALPVRLKATVLCYDGEWNQLYLHDGQETRYFNPRDFNIPLEPGQVVELTGQRVLAGAGWKLISSRLTVLGKTPLPAAKQLPLTQLASELGQWIEISGRVRVVDTSRGRLALQIHDEGPSVVVYIMGPLGTNNFKWLIDARVRVRGINLSRTSHGRLEKASITAPALNEVAVLERSSVAPLEIPALSIGSLLNQELGAWTNRRVRLNGLVCSYEPGESIVIKDPTGFIRAQVIQATSLHPESRVDLWGFLAAGPTEVGLTDACFELRQASPAVLREMPPDQPGGNGAELTSIGAILKLHRAEAARGQPVRLRGVMTYADPGWGNGFLQDTEGGIYVDLHQTDVRPGQWVEVQGRLGPGGFAPEVLNSTVRVLGTTNFPNPIRVDLGDIAEGHLDAHWIEIEGVVRRVSTEWGHAYLHLMSRHGRFAAIIPVPENQPSLDFLLDSFVTLQGACGSELNERRQLSGLVLHIPSLEQVRVLQPAAADPFTVETTPIGEVATFDPDRLAGRRVKVQGIVTMPIPEGFYLQDKTGGLRVHTRQTNTVQAGDTLDVLGFPALGEFSPRLEEASFRRTGSGSAVVPKLVTAEQILLHGTNDGALVALQARLLQNVPRSASPELTLQDGPIVFTARVETAGPKTEIPALPSGSLIRLTGVCAIQSGESHEPKSFRLLLVPPGKIQLLQGPPWWNVRRTLILVGGLVLLLAAILAWVILLRREVRSQTRVIRQQLQEHQQFAESLDREKNLLATLIDHLPDNVFVKDKDGRYVLTNLAHTQFHGAPDPRHFLGKTVFELMPPELASRCAETDRMVLERHQPVQDSEETMPDGRGAPRLLTTTKVPLKDKDGVMIGLVGISRDVTDRRKAERKLQEAQTGLLQASRLAGMAEVATSVLHNVGNVLNSVNVSTTLISETVKRSKVPSVARLGLVLRDHADDLGAFVTADPRGRQLPEYLSQLGAHLLDEHEAIAREMESVRNNVGHIKDIVAMQQDYARVSGVSETLRVTDLVEDALRLNTQELRRHGFEVVRQFDTPLPEITTEKHKLLQILVNLIRNAELAGDESGRKDKRLVLRVGARDGFIRIAVIDNGVGISAENLKRIFNHGFTTRKHGHGFGLHSAALAAHELGGSLTVQSDGLGHGATFTLELPLCPKPKAGGPVNA